MEFTTGAEAGGGFPAPPTVAGGAATAAAGTGGGGGFPAPTTAGGAATATAAGAATTATVAGGAATTAAAGAATTATGLEHTGPPPLCLIVLRLTFLQRRERITIFYYYNTKGDSHYATGQQEGMTSLNTEQAAALEGGKINTISRRETAKIRFS